MSAGSTTAAFLTTASASFRRSLGTQTVVCNARSSPACAPWSVNGIPAPSSADVTTGSSAGPALSCRRTHSGTATGGSAGRISPSVEPGISATSQSAHRTTSGRYSALHFGQIITQHASKSRHLGGANAIHREPRLDLAGVGWKTDVILRPAPGRSQGAVSRHLKCYRPGIVAPFAMLLSSHYGESHRECASQARIRGSHLPTLPAGEVAENRQILDEFCHVAD